MNKLKLLILIGFMSSSLISVAQIESTVANTIPFQPTLNDVEYIYNRVLDIMIRSKHISNRFETFVDFSHAGYDSMIVTVEPELSKIGLSGLKYQEAIPEWIFESPIGVQRLFDRVFFVNQGEFQRKPKNPPYSFKGNEVMHIWFSDLYQNENRLFLGALILNKIINPDYYTGQSAIFEIEICAEKILLFRKYYVTLGAYEGKGFWREYEFDDVPCD